MHKLNLIHGFLHSSMQCVRYQSHRTLFSQLRENRTKIAAIGSGCTLATEPAAEISHFWNIPQVQHVVLSEQLSFVLTGKSHQLKLIHLRTQCTNKSMQNGNSNFYLLQKTTMQQYKSAKWVGVPNGRTQQVWCLVSLFQDFHALLLPSALARGY